MTTDWLNEWINFINVSIKYLAEGKSLANRGHLTKHKNVLNWLNLYKAIVLYVGFHCHAIENENQNRSIGIVQKLENERI